MKVYKITYQRYQDRYSTNVFARDAAQAIEYVKRWLKRKYYSDAEVVAVEKVLEVQVHYRR